MSTIIKIIDERETKKKKKNEKKKKKEKKNKVDESYNERVRDKSFDLIYIQGKTSNHQELGLYLKNNFLILNERKTRLMLTFSLENSLQSFESLFSIWCDRLPIYGTLK